MTTPLVEPLISAVIIARNEERTINLCLTAAKEGLMSVGGGDILLVDSASRDSTVSRALAFGCRAYAIRRASTISPSAGRWLGARMTQSRYVLFLDGDCLLEPGFLSVAVQALEGDPTLGVVAGRRKDYHRLKDGDLVAAGDYYQQEESPSSSPPRYGGCALYRRSVLERAGSFNPFLRAKEEEDLAYRILACGYRIEVLPVPMIRHITVPRESIRRIIRNYNHGFFIGLAQAARIFLKKGKFRAAWSGLNRMLMTLANALLGVAALGFWIVTGVSWPIWLWIGLSLTAFLAFAVRGGSFRKAAYYVCEWLIQGAFLVVGFFTPTPAVDQFQWEGEEIVPGSLPDSILPRVLLVGPLPDPPLRGGVERGVDLLLRSRLSDETSMRFFNTYRRRDRNRWMHERLAYQWKMISAFRRELAAHACDLVHVKTSSGINFLQNSLYALVARMKGLPVVLQIHCGKFPSYFESSSGWIRAWIRHSLTSVSCIAVLSDAWAERISAIAPGARTSVVPNGLEDRELELLHDPAGKQGVLVLFMGTGDVELNWEKGLDDLLAVLPGLAVRHPESRWVIAGLPDAERVSAKLNSVRSTRASEPGQIRCLGNVDGEEKLSLLRSGTILVLPSHFENMPNIVLEAMAAEMAIVATAVGAVPEMLGHGEGGFLVRPGDREALRKGLERLLSSPMTVHEQGRRNREVVARDFTMEVVQRKLRELYLRTAGWMAPERGKGMAEILVPGLGVRKELPFTSRRADRP